jgi:hypothetical protein
VKVKANALSICLSEDEHGQTSDGRHLNYLSFSLILTSIQAYKQMGFPAKLLKASLLNLGVIAITSLFILSLSFDFQRAGYHLDSFSYMDYTLYYFRSDNISESFHISRSIILRGLCFCYLVAFRSLAVQAEGLFSYHYGLLPLENTLHNIQKVLKRSKSSYPPSPTNVASSDRQATELELLKNNPINMFALQLTLWIMIPTQYFPRYLDVLIGFSCFVAAIGLFSPHPIVMVICYVVYMAFKKIGGVFLNFAWDALLLEAGFYAIIMSLASTPMTVLVMIWLYRLLLFRLLFGSGMVKVFSKDKAWNESFTAIHYHFLTQPLPKYISSLLCLLPSILLKTATISVMLLESLGPILSLFPACEAIIFVFCFLLQAMIMLSGNYGNFLLCLMTFL